jgi:hypothetical protein
MLKKIKKMKQFCSVFITIVCFFNYYNRDNKYRNYGLRRFLGNSLYSHGHGISSVVVIQLTLAVRQGLYIYTHPTLEFLTWMSCGILIFIVRDRISVTKILNVSHSDNKV